MPIYFTVKYNHSIFDLYKNRLLYYIRSLNRFFLVKKTYGVHCS